MIKLPQAPEFWWSRRSVAGMALSPFGAIYGEISGRRMARHGVTVDVPVMCVGNFVVGGAGKTPTALEVASVCRKLNLNPGFLTRGYRGRESGPLLVSLAVHTPHDVGDEALLLAQFAPTVVAADRPSGAKLLASLGTDVVIMDDGLQNPSLDKDLTLVVVDAAPRDRQRLRASGRAAQGAALRTRYAAADALVVLGEGEAHKPLRVAARAGLPILRAKIESARRRGLQRHAYLAFAGIGDPGQFLRDARCRRRGGGAHDELPRPPCLHA